ncbi:hypothetical protein HDU76_000542 [Blyttiomyces sp. JEL0837]|nr:hypothetical protein HDU76_000542 [Blyttiomyces sp. JEL0837]
MLAVVTLVALLAQSLAVQAWIPGDRHPQSPVNGGRGSLPFCYEEAVLTNPGQPDLFTTVNTGNVTFSDRNIPISIWLPLTDGPATQTGVANNTSITYKFPTPVDLKTGNSFVSYRGVAHGKKEFWSGHAEALASKGFVVVAIDHTDSLWTTFDKLNALGTASIASALLNRRQDQLFVYDQIVKLGSTPGNHQFPYLYNNVDTTKTTVWGFSFGGYGAVLTSGATINTPFLQAVGLGPLIPFFAPLETPSTRDGIKAFISFAPWGNGVGFLGGSQMVNVSSMTNIKTPHMMVAGELDDVAGYQGIVGMFKGMTNSPGRVLVTLKNAAHNIALNPPPAEWVDTVDSDTWQRIAEQNWDHRFLHNVGQHLAYSFIEQVVLNNNVQTSSNPAFQVTPVSGPDATGTTTPRSIPGFSFRTADGVYIDFE